MWAAKDFTGYTSSNGGAEHFLFNFIIDSQLLRKWTKNTKRNALKAFHFSKVYNPVFLWYSTYKEALLCDDQIRFTSNRQMIAPTTEMTKEPMKLSLLMPNKPATNPPTTLPTIPIIMFQYHA